MENNVNLSFYNRVKQRGNALLGILSGDDFENTDNEANDKELTQEVDTALRDFRNNLSIVSDINTEFERTKLLSLQKHIMNERELSKCISL